MSTRGEFLGAITLAAIAPAVPRFPAVLQKPPMLERGDRVGLIAPASPPTGDDVARATANVESLGLVPVLGEYVRRQNGFLAGSDGERAADFNAMARDPKIRAIVAIRGGYGTMRILSALDYAAIARDPKIVMGFSDLTALLNAVTERSGVVTFHGPVGAHGSSWNGVARSYLEAALFAAQPQRLRIGSLRTILPGRARGRLAGGNLSLVAALLGTPYAVPAAGALLFLEETEEQPYRIDRMLTQLELAGDLAAARGILFGQCSKCAGAGPTPAKRPVTVSERTETEAILLDQPTAGNPPLREGDQVVIPKAAPSS